MRNFTKIDFVIIGLTISAISVLIVKGCLPEEKPIHSEIVRVNTVDGVVKIELTIKVSK